MTDPKRGTKLILIALPICVVVSILGIAFPDSFANLTQSLMTEVFGSFDWYFVASINIFIVICLWLALSRHGRLRLGNADDQPDFSFWTWFAMLLAAGIGGNILFYGVAEPLIHYVQPPGGGGGTLEPARKALLVTMYHWGFHGWAVYALGGLVLAYFHYRKKTSLLPSAPLTAVFSGRWVKYIAHVADLIAVLSVAFGVASVFALGTFQLQSGLELAGLVPVASTWVAVSCLTVACICYLISASGGINKGIKYLSQMNIVLAILFLILVLFFGPTLALLEAFAQGAIDYLGSLPRVLTTIYPFTDEVSWVHAWSVTYFVWWVAWAPFVGVFIARISRGRTIREFVLGVMGAPTLFCLIWFSVFGVSAIIEEMTGASNIASAVIGNQSSTLFVLLKSLPLYPVLAGLALGLVFVFLVTSLDSATYVLGMLTSDGSENPPTIKKISWGFGLAILGSAMIVLNKVDVIRSTALLGAIPFMLIMQLQIAALIIALRSENSV